MKKGNSNLTKKLILYLFYLSAFFYFISFNFQDSRTGGWYQQWFPNLNGSTITSMTFLDSLTGYAVTSINTDTLAYILKTTNGGVNWTAITGETFQDIKFIDTLIGWKTYGINILEKTTNGGLNWFSQQIPLQSLFWGGHANISKINKDSVWIVGGYKLINGFYYGILHKTTNGGNNWGYQIPDTSYHIGGFYKITFVNKNIGWAYSSELIQSEVHTLTGGNDTTYFTSINNITKIPPKNFELKQNYPNPFNNSSLIEYYINEPGWVKLKIYDMSGREMGTLVNEVQNTGSFGVPVSIELSSGVYIYKLVYINKKGELQTDTKKMVVIK